MRAPLLRIVRLSTYIALTAPLMPVQALLVALGLPLAGRLALFYHRLCWRILGLRIVQKGERSTRHPTLFVANHVSYLDITVLGGVIKGSFIAKSEVRRWPLFGWLARLQRTVFVERRPQRSAEQRDVVSRRLAAGEDLILFPEGTSSDGNRVLPFKSALFGAAEMPLDGRTVSVQPVSIAYTRLNGMPMGRSLRPFFAWYGDMELGPHLWELLGFGIVTVSLEFHPVVTRADFASRKALAEHCQRAVADGVTSALSGRERAVEAPSAALPSPGPSSGPSLGPSSPPAAPAATPAPAVEARA
jgi:1-acyl-sn-glycerol-3-phosphate acyltransferase